MVGSRRSALTSRVAAGMVAIAALLSVAPHASASIAVLGHQGRWLTDPKGRVVVLHGAQIDRFIPGTPDEGYVDVSPENVTFMAQQGFNVARVSLAYAGVEPRLGQFDDAYVQSFLSFDRELADAGVYDLIDMMQGEYSSVVGGGGFPAWMTDTSGLPNDRDPFPRGYLDNPAEDAAWDNFWANAPAADGVGFQDHYARGLRHLAGLFATAPGLLALEILNEPWPGSRWPTCASPLGCPPAGFDQTSLTDFYRRTVPAVRAGDPTHLIGYEPNLLFDFGAPTELGGVGDAGLLFAFHDYCLGAMPGEPAVPDPLGLCGIDENMVFANADARAQAGGGALLLDEWGNTTDLSLLNRMASEADAHMVGWSYWAYEDCCGSPAAIVNDATKPPSAPGNLNAPVLGAIERPYPQAVAGTPTSWSYDPGSRTFTLDYRARQPNGKPAPNAPTAVFVPALHYPTGYRVSVSGARVVSSPTAGTLLLCNSAGAGSVSVSLVPGAGSSTGLPAPAPSSCRSRRR